MRPLPRQAVFVVPTLLVVILLGLTTHTVVRQRNAAEQPQEASGQFSLTPKVHLLDMPSALKNDFAQCASLCGSPVPYNGSLDSAYGPAKGWPSDMRHLNPPWKLRQTSQFALTGVLKHRLRPASVPLSDADFVLLDIDDRGVLDCIGVGRCPGKAEQFRAAGMGDHNLATRFEDWLIDVASTLGTRHSYPSLLMPLSRIERDYSRSAFASNRLASVQKYFIMLGIEREWDVRQVFQKFITMPYPTRFHLDEGQLVDQSWVLDLARPYLVSFGGRIDPGGGRNNGISIRHALYRQLSAALPNDRIHISANGTRTSNFSPHRVLHSSVFCLQPAGDSPSRSSVWESIQCGCIPVIFRTSTYRATSWDFGDYEEHMLSILEDEIVRDSGPTILERLDAIPVEEVRQRQEAMAKFAAQTQYHIALDKDVGAPSDRTSESRGDAVDYLLRQLATVRDTASLL